MTRIIFSFSNVPAMCLLTFTHTIQLICSKSSNVYFSKELWPLTFMMNCAILTTFGTKRNWRDEERTVKYFQRSTHPIYRTNAGASINTFKAFKNVKCKGILIFRQSKWFHLSKKFVLDTFDEPIRSCAEFNFHTSLRTFTLERAMSLRFSQVIWHWKK